MTVPATDEDLIRDYAITRSSSALETLVARHWPLAYRVALRTLGDPAAAEDVAQTALVHLVRGARRFEPGKRFLPWFRTLVGNAVRNALRSRRTRARHEERFAATRETAVNPSLESSVLASEIEARLATLEPDVRLPLVLHYYEGCSHADVALALGCPTGTASSRIRRGLEQLRESLLGAGVSASFADLEQWGAAASSRNAALAVPPAPGSRPLEALASRSALGALGVKILSAVLIVGLCAAAASRALDPRSDGPGEASPGRTSSTSDASAGDDHGTGDASLSEALGEGSASVASGLSNASSITTASGHATGAPDDEGAASLEADRAPGPYPWAEVDENDAERILRSQRVTLRFDHSPLADILEFVNAVTEVPVHTDPLLDERVHQLMTFQLDVRDQSLLDALELTFDAVAEPGFEPRFVVRDGEIAIVPAGARGPHVYPRPRSVSSLLAEDPRGSDADREVKEALETRRVSLHLVQTPLSLVLGELKDQTRLSFVSAQSVDAVHSLMDVEAEGAPVSETLAALLAKSGLGFEVSRGVVLIFEEADRPRRTLAARRVTLDLRGVTVSELVATLASQGVEAVASEDAWCSRGTFSLVVHDAPVSELVATISSATPFAARIGERSRTPLREVVALSGKSLGAQESLAAKAPGGFPGIDAELEELKARLAPELTTRAAARKAQDSAPAALFTAEASVARTVARIEHLLVSARRYDDLARPRELGKTIDLDALRATAAEARAAAAKDLEESERERVRFVPGSEEESAFVKEHEAKRRKLEDDARQVDRRLAELTRVPVAPWVHGEEALALLLAGERLDVAERSATHR